MGARDLTHEEELLVTGAGIPRQTLTICTIPNAASVAADGDPGECA